MTLFVAREWSRANDSAFFLRCGRTVSSCSSRLVDDVCLHGIRDPNFMMATLICFLETQHAVRDGESSMHTDSPFVF